MGNNNNQRPELGIIGLLLAMLILGAIIAFLADYTGLRYGNFGATHLDGSHTIHVYLWACYFMHNMYCQKKATKDGCKGLNCSFVSTMNLRAKYLRGGQQQTARRSGPRRSRQQKPPPSPPQILPESFKTVRAGIVPSHRVITLLKGNDFSRAAGPGFVTLFRGEKIDKIIDLRDQKREQDLAGTTRDGIPVTTKISVTFRVQQQPISHAFDSLIYPFDKESIFPISSYTSIDENGHIRLWSDQLIMLAAGELSNELSTYNVDDLQHTFGEHSIKSEIQQRIQRKLSRTAAEHGLELLRIDIEHFDFPPSVTEQRIKTWQADWQRKIDVKHAAGDAEAERRIKQARARAQIEIIERIMQSIDTMQQSDDTNLTEIITLRMIEALEEATTSDSVQALIPQQVMTNLVLDASNQMQTWLARQSGGESK